MPKNGVKDAPVSHVSADIAPEELSRHIRGFFPKLGFLTLREAPQLESEMKCCTNALHRML